MLRKVAALLVCLLMLVPGALAEESWGDFAQYETPFDFTADSFQECYAACVEAQGQSVAWSEPVPLADSDFSVMTGSGGALADLQVLIDGAGHVYAARVCIAAEASSSELPTLASAAGQTMAGAMFAYNMALNGGQITQEFATAVSEAVPAISGAFIVEGDGLEELMTTGRGTAVYINGLPLTIFVRLNAEAGVLLEATIAIAPVQLSF